MTRSPLTLVLLAVLLLAGCSATRIQPQASLPPPLVDKLPVRVGIHFPEEFRNYAHKEKRNNVTYEVALGAAHVANLKWLLGAMFAELVPVEDPAAAALVRPPLTMVLEPRFEEYSFLTPRDLAGEAYIVTIRYLLTVYDGGGARVDSYIYTGYGRQKSSGVSSTQPLTTATQRAMRDAGAKVAVELTSQDAVRMLLRGRARVQQPVAPPVADPMPPPDPAAGPGPEDGSGT